MKNLLKLTVCMLALICLITSCGGSQNDNQSGNNGNEPSHIHEYGDWRVVQKPTCTEDGVDARFCACGEKQTEVIPALGHEVVVDSAVEATCTKDGLTEGKHCSVCDEVVLEQKVITALGHDLIVDYAVEPTCTESGLTEGAYCTKCDYKANQEVVSALGHDIIVDPGVDVTCIKDGLTEGSHCTRCEYRILQEVIPALGHDLIIDPAVDPTCTKDGLTEGSHCAWCSHKVKQEIIPALGHNYGSEWSYDENSHWHSCANGCESKNEVSSHIPNIPEATENDSKICTVCNYVIEQALGHLTHKYTIPQSDATHHWNKCYGCNLIDTKVEHSYVEDIVAQPSCTKNGAKTLTCYCGYSKNENILALGHSIVIDHSLAPTCVNTGLTEGSHCTRCDYKIAQKSIPSTGHSYSSEWSYDENTHWHSCANDCDIKGSEESHTLSDWIVEIESTTNSEGLKYKECKVCHRKDAEEIIPQKSLEFSLSNDGTYYILTGIGTCTDTRVIIPSTYNNKPVKSIGDSAFWGCESLVSIEIPNSIASIGKYAFCGCSKLANIEIPDNVTSIGQGAFGACTSLESITVPFVGETMNGIEKTYFGHIFGAYSYNTNFRNVPSSLKIVIITGGNIIDEYSFYGCSSITSITIADDVTSIGDSAFYNCYSLTGVTFDENSQLTSIGEYAFSGCSKLLSIEIPDNVTSIDEYAFYNCTSLTSVTFDENSQLISIGKSAFYKCTSLTSVTFDENSQLTSIDECVFYECYQLSNIEIPDSITSIGRYAFGDCDSLTSITIPDSVTSIGEYAFSSCSKLLSIEIPNSVMTIGIGAFQWCYSISTITVPFTGSMLNGDENTHFGYIFGAESYTENDSYVPKNLKTVVLTGENCVRQYAFYECKSIRSVEIANGVTKIYDEAFYNCSSLENIVIPNSIVHIGWWAFRGCDSLRYNKYNDENYLGNESNPYYALVGANNYNTETISVHPSTKLISEDAFRTPNYSYLVTFTTLEISDSVEYISSWALTYCDSLKNISVSEDNSHYKSIDGNLYSKDGKTLIRYAPGKAEEIFLIIDGVTNIGEYAFEGCSELTGVIIPKSVTNIGYAFYNCDSFTDVFYLGTMSEWQAISLDNYDEVLMNAVVHFNYDVNNPYYLKYTLSNDGTYYTISGVKDNKLSYIEIPSVYNDKPVKEIGMYAFSGCSLLKSIDIPNSIISICSYAFEYCRSLSSIDISQSITDIDHAAFRGCTSLSSINVDDGNLYYESLDGNLYDESGYSLIQYSVGKTDDSFVIPNGVKFILPSAFYECDSLVRISIPDSVTYIGDDAFCGCSSLENVVIPNSVTDIWDQAFRNCTSLESVTIGEGLNSIGMHAFMDCNSLKYVYISDISLWCKIEFEDTWSNPLCNGATLYVGNKNVATDIIIPNSVTSIGDYAFYDCSSLTSIVIPDSVTSIGDYAFSGCDSLKHVYYTGTEDEWKNISIGPNNSNLTSATIHYNYVPEE